MRYLFILLIAVVFNIACVNQGNTAVSKVSTKTVVVETQVVGVKKFLANHTRDYKTMAQSIPNMPPSKKFRYDNQYAIPAVGEAVSPDSSALIIPPESKR